MKNETSEIGEKRGANEIGEGCAKRKQTASVESLETEQHTCNHSTDMSTAIPALAIDSVFWANDSVCFKRSRFFVKSTNSRNRSNDARIDLSLPRTSAVNGG
jgi:hypothetical protein